MSTPSTARYPSWTPPPSRDAAANLKPVPKALVFDLPRMEPTLTRHESFPDTVWRHAWIYNEPVGSWRRALGALVAAFLLPTFIVVALVPMFVIMIPIALVAVPLTFLALIGAVLGRRR